MDSRHAAAYQSLLRIVHYVDRHDDVRALAAESNAIALLRDHIAQFETLTQQQSVATLGSPGLTAQRNVLRRLLWTRLDTIRCATDYARLKDSTVPEFRTPAIDTHTALFVANARSTAAVADEHMEVLVAYGLQRSVINEIPPLANALEQLVTERRAGVASGRAATSVLPLVLRSARKLIPLIRRQLEPAMTPELLAEWKQVVSLGRTHRPKALRSGAVRRLRAAIAAHPAPNGWSIGGMVRRIVLRLVGARDGSSRPQPDADYTVGEIKRLPAPDFKPTGTDVL